MSHPSLPMVFTKAKTIAASIGATCTAIVVFVGVLLPDLSDNKIDGGEATALVLAFISLVGTVYAVWRTPNKVLSSGNTAQR